jgi:hypothetical protein
LAGGQRHRHRKRRRKKQKKSRKRRGLHYGKDMKGVKLYGL